MSDFYNALGYLTGTAGQVFLSNGPGQLPTFQNQPFVINSLGSSTTAAPSQKAVNDALALKANVTTGIVIRAGKTNITGGGDAISFGYTFASAPTVIVGYERNSGGTAGWCCLDNSSVTTTGATVRAFTDNGSQISSGTCHWIAIGA